MSESDFAHLASKDVAEEELSRLKKHRDTCPDCRARFDQFASEQRQMEEDLRAGKTTKDCGSSGRGGEAGGGPGPPGGEPRDGLQDEYFPKIPGYRIVREIGSGGMGRVFEAVQLELNRTVALKVLLYKPGQNYEAARARFVKEAQMASRLHHSHIVPIYDFKRVGNDYFYAMELVEGQLLSSLVKDFAATVAHESAAADPAALERDSPAGRTPSATTASPTLPANQGSGSSGSGSSSGSGREYYKRVAGWIRDVAEALHYTHEQGIIHRDIKPNNLILCQDGRMMILDFGLAKDMKADDDLTLEGDFLGTPAYMSPELAMAKRMRVDHRTDIFSLGATFYELLAYRMAFSGKDREATLQKVIARNPVRPRKVVSGVPKGLEEVCLKMLERHQDDRFQTAKQVVDTLERYIQGKPPDVGRRNIFVRAFRVLQRRPAACIAACAILLAIAGVTKALQYYEQDKLKRCEQLIREAQAAHSLQSRAYEKADGLFNQACELCPDSFSAWGNWARMKHEQWKWNPRAGLLDQAENYLGNALILNPKDSALQNLRGLILRDQGNEEVISIFQDAIQKDPTNYAPYTNLATVHVKHLKFNEAEDVLKKAVTLADEKAKKDDTTDEYRFMPRLNLAAVQMCARRETAAKTLENLGEGASQLPVTHLLRAKLQLDLLGNSEEAANEAIRAGAAGQSNYPHANKAQRLLALAYLRSGDFERAVSVACRALGGEASPASAGPGCENVKPAPITLAMSAGPPKWDFHNKIRLHLILVVALANNRRLVDAHEQWKRALEVWRSDVQHGITRPQVENGYVWFDCDDELIELRNEAERLLGLPTSAPTQ